MPVPHDLYQDLSMTKEDIQQKRAKDARLDSLLNQYSSIDREVVAAESAASDAPTDDALKKLKETRVLIKNQIVQKLK